MKSIEQVVVFDATPSQVFEALMDSNKHAAIRGEPATVSREIGGAFVCGMISGINLDLVTDQRIVQAWRPANFPPGVFTLATFALAADGHRTKLTFTQEAIPDAAHEHLTKGWETKYWQPMRAFLAKHPA